MAQTASDQTQKHSKALYVTYLRLRYVYFLFCWFQNTPSKQKLPFQRRKCYKGEGKKSPKRKNQILDLTEETAATENQLSLTLAPERPDSMGNFVSLADHTYLEDKNLIYTQNG